jgi:hypothetical protein
MADVREEIMARITTLIGGLTGVETAARNLDEIADIKLPAIVLYDGDEEASPDNLRATGLKPTVIHATPQIFVKIQDTPDNVGTSTNAWRAAVLSTLLGDQTLAAICGIHSPYAGVRFVGAATSLIPGRLSQVSMTLHFSICYEFKPDQL